MSNDVNNQTEQSAAESQTTVDETTAFGAPAADEEQGSAEVDFGKILEQFEAEQIAFHSGELVQGKVVGISDRGILIDFGYKSEGVAPREDFSDTEGNVTVKPGDDVEVVIKRMDTGDSAPELSFSDAKRRKAWVDIEKAFNDETPVKGRIVGKTKGGLNVDIDGVEAFMPSSLADSRPVRDFDALVGQEIEAKIIKFSRKRNNIVLSRKVLTDEIADRQKEETLGLVETGYIVDGTIKNLTEYGAFVDIGGIDGLLHITDMSWGRLQHSKELFKPGDSIQVKVLKLDREKGKIGLGYKQLLPDPWSVVPEIYPVGSNVKGTISSVADYGAFVELEPNVEGLVHVSEMSWSKRGKAPKQLVNPGDEVEVRVLGIDMHDRRISLGMKQLQPNPWDTIEDRYQTGAKVRGTVRNVTDFGAFIEVEEGVEGLVHISDISHSKKIKHPKDVLKKGQEVDAVITKIDRKGRRLSLSIKELVPSAWETFLATHRPGDVVRGKVSRFTNFGVFVELGEDLEGLCHISELSDERVNRAEDVVQLGQEMDFKILRIEPDVQKIGLSHRAVGKEDEPTFDTKVYSTEAKGGMASLGELANLKFGRSEEPKLEEPKTTPSKPASPAASESENTSSGEGLTAELSAGSAGSSEESNGAEASDKPSHSADDEGGTTVDAETPAGTSTDQNPDAESSVENSEIENSPESAAADGEAGSVGAGDSSEQANSTTGSADTTNSGTAGEHAEDKSNAADSSGKE
jgi:small subunit ribosomal protein S1